MVNSLSAVQELFHASAAEQNIEVLRCKFVNALDQMENTKPSLFSAVDAAFRGLDIKKLSVSFFRYVAEEVAQHVDDGEDGSSKNAFHNALHFSKVVVNFRALTLVHNSLYPDEKLSDKEVASGLFAATAHDIGHDGLGNSLNGKHQQFRLEQCAINTALKWVEPWDDRERAVITEALMPIYATDVSSDGVNISPARYMRARYDSRLIHAICPSTPYSQFLDKKLSTHSSVLVSCLLHDADIFASLINKKSHLRENDRVSSELKLATGNPLATASSLWFMETMLSGRTTTDVARQFTDTFMSSYVSKLKTGATPA